MVYREGAEAESAEAASTDASPLPEAAPAPQVEQAARARQARGLPVPGRSDWSERDVWSFLLN